MRALVLCAAIALHAFSALADTDSVNNKNAWDGWNDPYKMDANFENRLNVLPTSGELSSRGLAWPGYYWANNKGGIAQRWTSKDPQNFKYESPSLYELKNMSKEQINELSPAEKYDLYVGSYDYPTVKQVWDTTRKGESAWHGICHGVSPASLNHSEPKAITVKNKDGIEVTFYASDVKALLAYYYAKISDTDVVQVGKRCFVSGSIPLIRNISGCNDVNPGAFHIIMANKLGISKTGFISDMDRYVQVWNHAAVNYETKIMGKAALTKDAADTATSRVKVRTKVKYAASIDPALTPVIATASAKYDTREYSYYLELNSKGEIVGGEWISRDRPDFMWIKGKDQFTGYWESLNTIYQPTK